MQVEGKYVGYIICQKCSGSKIYSKPPEYIEKKLCPECNGRGYVALVRLSKEKCKDDNS